MDKDKHHDDQDLFNLHFENGKSLDDFIKELNSLDVSCSYDYEELIFELKADKAEGLIGTKVYTEWEEVKDYPRPVLVDYYYSLSDVPLGTKVKVMEYDKVIHYLEWENSLFKE